jgi:ABC-type Na+ efflux pump permease subunit
LTLKLAALQSSLAGHAEPMKPFQTLKSQSLTIALLIVVSSLIAIQFSPVSMVFAITAAIGMIGLVWRLYRALHRQIGVLLFSNRYLRRAPSSAVIKSLTRCF